jgi:hypothetical protein
MDTSDLEVYARVADLLVSLTTSTNQLREVVVALNHSVTNLTALGLRLEAKLDAVPAE